MNILALTVLVATMYTVEALDAWLRTRVKRRQEEQSRHSSEKVFVRIRRFLAERRHVGSLVGIAAAYWGMVYLKASTYFDASYLHIWA